MGASRQGRVCARVLVLAAGAWWAASAAGQGVVTRPAAAGRVVATFDFEERETNPNLFPRNWYASQDDPKGARRPGFPAWNAGKLVYEGGAAAGGVGVFSLETRGGSTAAELGAGVVPVFENADYRVRTRVRTRGLQHAGACVSARLLDASGKLIPGSEVRSECVRSDGSWTDVRADVPGLFAGAAWLQIELMLLQPEQASGGGVGPFHVWKQDYQGDALFDDVVVTQLPRVELSTADTCNVFESPARVEVRGLVRDLAGEALVITLEARDVDGRVVDQRVQPALTGATELTWQPRLPGLGWYRVDLTVAGPEGPVGSASTTVVWGGPGASGGIAGDIGERGRFGLVFPELSPVVRGAAVSLVAHSGSGQVTLPAWSADLTVANAPERARSLAELVGGMLTAWHEVTVSLPCAPSELVKQVRTDPSSAWDVLLGDEKVWKPYAVPFFDELGTRVARWQMGGVGGGNMQGDSRLYWRDDLAGELGRVRGVLSKSMLKPSLVLTGTVDVEWSRGVLGDGTPPASMALRVPPEADPEGMRQWAAGWASAGPNAAETNLVLEPAAWGVYRPRDGAAALSRQLLSVWAGLGETAREADLTVSIAAPWTTGQGLRATVQPRPELAAWREVTGRLLGRRCVGTFPVAEGVACFILAPRAGAAGSAALVAWNESAPDDRAVLEENLGSGTIRVVDIYGNVRAPEERTGTTGAKRLHIPLTDSPVFIEGIDLELARLLAGVAIQPAYLEANNEDHDRSILVTNPWNVGITGRVTVLEPGGFAQGQRDRSWRISPRTQTFSAGPRETVKVPLTVGFSPSEEAGVREFVLEFDVSAERTYDKVLVRRLVELGSTRFRLDLGYRTSGDDLLVDATVGNTGGGKVDLNITGFAPGLPRSKSTVSELSGGHQAVRTFMFAGAAARLRGQRVVVRAVDPETGVSVSRSLVVR